MPEDLISRCEKAIKACLAEGAEEAEAFCLTRDTFYYRLSEAGGERLLEAYRTERTGVAIRVFREGRLGFSFTTDLSEEALREAARSALKASGEVESFEGFPSPSRTAKLGLFDEEVAGLTEEDCAERLKSMVEQAGDKLIVPEASFGRSIVRFGVANTSGLEAEDEGTFVRASITLRARGAPTAVSSTAVRRELSGLDMGSLVEECASMALLMAEPGGLEPGEYDVVLSPDVVSELVAYALVSSLRADNVRLGTSALKGKLGEQVASPVVTLLDDPTSREGLCSFGIDDEGMPVRRKALIEKGVLKGLLYDSLEAGLQGTEPTGNCVRWEPPLVDPFYPRDYRFRPGIYPVNLALEPGGKEHAELISELGEGVLAFRSLSGFGMRPSGEFSLYITNGFLVEGGEVKKGLGGFSMRGNIFDLLGKIEAVSSDREPLFPDMAGFCTIMPYVLVRGVELIP